MSKEISVKKESCKWFRFIVAIYSIRLSLWLMVFSSEFQCCYDSLFLKKMAYVFLSVNCLVGLFSLHFCLFRNWLSFNTIYVSFACKNDPTISSFLGSIYNCCTSCLYFSISKIFTHVPGIFTVTLQVISIPPWTIGSRR